MRTKFPYIVLALLIVGIWGVTFISTKVLLTEGLSPEAIFFLRFPIAYCGMALFSLLSGKGYKMWSDNVQDEFYLCLLGIAGGSLYFYSENKALAYTQACDVSFIVCTSPLLMVLLAFLLRAVLPGKYAAKVEKVNVTPKLVLGTVLAIVGTAVVLFDGARFAVSEKALLGDILALVASLTWAIYSIYVGNMTKKYGPLFTTRKVFFYGLLTIVPFTIHNFPSTEILFKPAVLYNILFLGLVASLACYALWNVVLVRLGGVTATNLIYLNPFFTLVAAVTVLGEKLTPTAAIGSAILVIGVILATYKHSNHCKHSNHKDIQK